MALQNLRSNTANKRPTASGMVDGQVAINTNATNPGLFFKDAGDGIRKVGPVFIGSSAPNSSPAVGGSSGHSIGEQWLDTSGSRYVLKTWDGTAWRDDDSNYLQLTGGALSGALTIDNAANVAALDLKFDGDTDTGFYAPAANTLGFVGGGTERLRIDGNGRVGIGTTSPDALLDVENSSGASEIQIKSLDASDCTLAFGDNADTDVGRIRYAHSADAMLFFTAASERLRIDTSGNVGIGTTTTQAKLDVRTGAAGFAQFSHASGNGGVRITGEGASSNANLVFSNNRGVSTSDEYTIQLSGNNDRLAFRSGGTGDTERVSFMADGKVGIGTSSPAAKFEVSTGGGTEARITSTIDNNADLAFYTNSTKRGVVQGNSIGVTVGTTGSLPTMFISNNTERMRINSSGNVGIGTASPGSLLNLESTTSASLRIKNTTNNTPSVPHIELLNNNNQGLDITINRSGSDSRAKFVADTAISVETGGSERLRIDSSGRVGIGTSSPGRQLQINGDSDTQIRVVASAGGAAGIQFGDANDSVMGGVNFDASDDSLQLRGFNNSERLRIDSSGNVGIGTSAPNRKLQVAGATAITNSGDTGAFLFDPAGSVNTLLSRAGQSSTTALPLAVKMGNTQRLHIDSDGRVGVGLTPSSAESIANVAAGLIQTDGNIDIRYPGSNSDPAGTRYLSLINTDSTLVAGQPMGGIRWVGNDTSNTSRDTASILAFCQNNTGTSSNITFNNNGGTERMRIDSSGRLLVGTSSGNDSGSESNLVIESNSSGDNSYGGLMLRRGSTSIGSGTSLGRMYFADQNGNTGARISGLADGTWATDDYPGVITFDTTATGASSFTERMRIDSSGNVGIGHSSPASLLTVGGDVITTAKPTVSIAPSSGNGSIVLRGGSPTLSFDQTGGGDGTIIYDNSSDLLFKNGTLDSSSEVARIDSSGRILIGATGSYASSNADDLQVGDNTNSAQSGITLGSTVLSSLRFADAGSDSAGVVSYLHSDDSMRFSTADSERMRIDSSGNLGVGLTSLPTSGFNKVIRIKSATGAAGIFAEASDASSWLGLYGGTSTSDSAAFLYPDTGSLRIGTTSVVGTPGFSEKLRIDNSGRMLIGTTTKGDGNADDITIATSGHSGITIRSAASYNGAIYFADGTTGNDRYRGYILYDHSNNDLAIGTDATERIRIDGSGRLLVGTTTNIAPDGFASKIQTAGTDYQGGSISIRRDQNSASGPTLTFAKTRSTAIGGNTIVQNGDVLAQLAFYGADGGDVNQAAGYIRCRVDGTPGGNDMPGRLEFHTTPDNAASPTERMRIDSSGDVFIGRTDDSSTAGISLLGQGFMRVVRDGNTPMTVDRLSSDGQLINFRQANTSEGSISVSGTTVSYNGAHLSRWSQLAGGVERTEILRGSVLSNIDEMCEWGEEDNEQLNRMQVSDVEGDPNVAGVFQAWDDDDDTYTNDFYCAMTGDFVIRIAQGTTVARGDLLMSAGDGTAKPQDDDIVRSKTVAKVTSTTVSTTYADGSYCVPCVLMAC